ncbi:acetyl-CoA carboxylase biotin carboxyl carrier protein [Anaerobacillus sp. MEB173]|uniref:acetyl-CoA carboxylase biotin carboxyl carrier protein n=1 Tax=Anaerobacillus sp. MEB173 TaxID=3383345 RepID=UPI003F8DB2F0
MLKVNDIKELIRAVDRSSIGELVISGENKEKITIRKQTVGVAVEAPVVPVQAPVEEVKAEPTVAAAPAPAPVKEEKAEAPAATDESLHKIVSPMVGTFYAAPAPDQDAYVKVGDKVTSDSVVCIVEAMKLMNELEAEVSGEIVEILVENGQLVEYGQPLFLVKE